MYIIHLSQLHLKKIINLINLSQKNQKTDNTDHNNLQKQFKRLEIELLQLINKFNQSFANIKYLKQKVNHQRNQRVIFSGIYKNLEKEINSNEECFKSCLVQNFLLNHQKQQLQEKYKKNKILNIKRNISEQQEQFKQSDIKILDSAIIYAEQQPIKSKKKGDLLKFFKDNKSQIINNQQVLKHQFLVDKLQTYKNQINKLMQLTPCDNFLELIQCKNDLESKNNQLYLKANKLNDQIYKLQQKITTSKKLNQQRIQEQKISQIHSNYNQIDIDQKINNQKQKIKLMMQQIYKIAKEHDIQIQNDINCADENEILRKIQQKMNKDSIIYQKDNKRQNHNMQIQEKKLEQILVQSKKNRHYLSIKSEQMFKKQISDIKLNF